MKMTVEEIKKHIEEWPHRDGIDLISKCTYRNFCIVLLEEIERLKNKKCVHDLAREYSASVGPNETQEQITDGN